MDAKTFYEQIAPELDPGGFKLYFTAQRLTGFELYKQFPYEDSRGMFEMMNGHQLMRYLLADQFQAIRWEIVPGTCYERAVLLPIDHTTPAYRAFEQKLYTAILQNYHLNPQKQHDRKEHDTGSSGKWPATMWRLFAFKSRQKTTDPNWCTSARPSEVR